jgi:hypothetical protein
MKTTVRALAEALDLWETIALGVASRLAGGSEKQLIDRVGTLPVRASHAVGLLGVYVHRGAEPLGIRLQPRQEANLLGVTLLHELAHACDHLTAGDPRRHRCTHGPGWRRWALTFGIDPVRSGHSPALAELRKARLKPVAVCERCGCVFHRLRRLAHRRNWIHPECGNGRVVPLPVPAGGVHE